MPVQSKGQHAIKVDVLESHRRQVADGLTVYLSLTSHPPAVQRALHLMGIPGHDKVGHERQCTGLGPEFLGAAAASGAVASAANLPLQDMGTLVVVEQAQRGAAEIRDAQGVTLVQGAQKQPQLVACPVALLAASCSAVALASQDGRKSPTDHRVGHGTQIRPPLDDRRQGDIGQARGLQHLRNLHPCAPRQMQPPIPETLQARTQIHSDKFAQSHAVGRIAVRVGHDPPDGHDRLAQCALDGGPILPAGEGIG